LARNLQEDEVGISPALVVGTALPFRCFLSIAQGNEVGVSPAWRKNRKGMKWAYLLLGEKTARE
jgi:hypothetical protein